MASNIKERIYKFDNIKLLTIMLVVVGHVIEPYVDKSDMFKSLFIFIYSFHMPLFIFISGLFQKRYSDENKLKINKVAFFVSMGFIVKIVNGLARMAGGKDFTITFFGSKTIDWYLFVLAMFMVTAYLTRKVHPAVMLAVSSVLGCVSGYFGFIDDTLYLSRYFVFLPLYLIGYYMTPQLLIKIEKNYIVKAISGAFMLFYFVVCFRNLNLVYKLRPLFTGRNPFENTDIVNCGFEHRLLCYGISIMLCMAVFCFIPNLRVPVLSNMGANTFAVYVWHRPMLYLLSATPFYDMIISLGDPLYKIILLSFGVLLTLFVSLNIFMAPINAFSKLINKLKPIWCYVVIFAPFVVGLITMYKELPSYFSYLLDKIKN